jgi:CBS domain containing-hemolysin-like protein
MLAKDSSAVAAPDFSGRNLATLQAIAGLSSRAPPTTTTGRVRLAVDPQQQVSPSASRADTIRLLMADPTNVPPTSKTPASSVIPTLIALLVLVPILSLSSWTVSAGLIALCGVYVAFEFALVKVSARTLQRDAQRGDARAQSALAMKHDMNAMLAACQFGITVTSLGLTLALEPAIHHTLELHARGLLETLSSYVEPRAFSVGTAMVAGSLLHVTFGELVPKGLALTVPLPVLYRTTPFMRMFRFVAVPFIKTCNGVANLVVRAITGKDPDKDISHDENIDLREALIHASTTGQIAPEQAKLFKNVLTFAERTAREVMTPAKNVVAVRLQDSWDDVKKVMDEHRFSRYPVLDGDWHRVSGYVRHVDFLRADAEGKRDLKALLRPIDRRPETVSISKLNLFQGSPLVALYDEHDSFVGLLSAEDVVEEIVGEIYDETDERASQGIQKLADGKVRVVGSVLLEVAAEALGLRDEISEDGDVDTVGGLVLKRLGRQPAVGDEVQLGTFKTVVEEVSGFRVVRLRFEPLTTRQAPVGPAG